MKVIHLISGGDSGGAKTHVHSLLRHLSRRMDVTMVCFIDGPFAREARELGIRTEIVEGRRPLRALKRLRAMVAEEGYDIIHCHGSRGNMMGALLARSVRLPLVTTVHSDYRLDYLGRPLSRLTYGTINALALRRMDYRIGVSDAMVDLLIARGFNPDRLFAIYNGLDFSPRPVAAPREAYLRAQGLHADGDCVVVGIAARLDAVKDVGTLIRGFAKAREACPQLRLLIAGEGGQGEELRALAARLIPQAGICRFTGWISDVDTFYNAIDINALTSLSETFPYALTEGARAGLPTVSSRVGGVPYLIDNGVNGLLFEPGDVETLARHLIALASDSALRAQMGGRLYRKAKAEFSLEATVARQMEIYETVLRRERRAKGARDGVLVCGAYGRGNAGDDAILEAILAELRALDRDLPVWVLSRSPRETRRAYRVNALYIFDVLRFLRRMGRISLYINGGGSLMQDITSYRSLWFYLFTIAAAKRRGSKVLMYGCGIGPIRDASNRRLTARVLQKNVDAITLRDPHSREELADMGVTAPEIVLSADPTVILPAAAREEVDWMMARRGLTPGGRYITFVLRPWPGFEEKKTAFAAAAEHAWRVHGLTPVFVPVEPYRDVAAAQKVTALLRCPFHALEDTGNSAQTIGLLARMEVVVSMRLHGLVFAAGQGVPLVGVVYDPKVSSFLSYIGQDLFTDLDSLTADRLIAQVDAACTRVGDTAFLTESVARLRRVEGRNSQTAAKLLGIAVPDQM